MPIFTLYGESDDLIESTWDGVAIYEWEKKGDDTYLHFEDGTVVVATYDEDDGGVWKFAVVKHGSALVTHIPRPKFRDRNEDEDEDEEDYEAELEEFLEENYSDKLEMYFDIEPAEAIATETEVIDSDAIDQFLHDWFDNNYVDDLDEEQKRAFFNILTHNKHSTQINT